MFTQRAYAKLTGTTAKNSIETPAAALSPRPEAVHERLGRWRRLSLVSAGNKSDLVFAATLFRGPHDIPIPLCIGDAIVKRRERHGRMDLRAQRAGASPGESTVIVTNDLP